MNIFISWSKDKSEKIAEATKNFLSKLFGEKINFFRSPEMKAGTEYDSEIHKNLLGSDKIIICLTKECFMSPWVLYEAGVVYGKNKKEDKKFPIVIPILFEDDKDWSSWVDKPLNRFKPKKFCKKEFETLTQEIEQELSSNITGTFINEWKEYEKQVKKILRENSSTPKECEHLYRTFKSKPEFCFKSPTIIDKQKVSFYRGFNTTLFYRIINEVVKQSEADVTGNSKKILWFYGRKNSLILGNENLKFYDYLAKNQTIDFRCLFVKPQSKAADIAERNRANFYSRLRNNLHAALNLKNKGLDPGEIFRVYSKPRKNAMIRIGDSIIFTPVSPDPIDGYPKLFTDGAFDLISAKSKEGRALNEEFEEAWTTSEPLTEDIANLISPNDMGMSHAPHAKLAIPNDFVVFISGVPGSGKTTISYELLKAFDCFRIIEETDLIREALRGYHEFIQGELKETQNYLLEETQITPHTVLLSLENSKKQCRIYKKPLEKIIERQKRKGIPTIINGVHVVPEILNGIANNHNIIFINLYLSNEIVLRERLRKKDPQSYMLNHVPFIFKANQDLYFSTSNLASASKYLFNNVDVTKRSINDIMSEIVELIQKRVQEKSFE